MTSIEWTDESWNVTRGCTIVSPGCKNCYAMRMAARFSDPGQWGHGYAERTASGVGRWTRRLDVLPGALTLPLSWRRPRRIFVNSASDLFHEDVPFLFLDDVYGVFAQLPQHTFQVLTKRAERMAEYILDRYARRGSVLPPNVWHGVSVESAEYMHRVDYLSPVVNLGGVTFVSLEPLLEDVADPLETRLAQGLLSWAITGGESGHGARPFDVDWARRIHDVCERNGVPMFLKQLGENPYATLTSTGAPVHGPLHVRGKGGCPDEWPEDMRSWRQWPEPVPPAAEVADA